MEVIMNYENFSENRVSDHDQLACAIKGNVTFMMMNQTNIDYVNLIVEYFLKVY